MRKPVNVINLTALNGTNAVSESATLDDGKIIGFAIYKNGVNNTGFVNASLDNNGNEVLPMHTVDNYRNRETEYQKGFIPLNIKGGSKFTVKIQATSNFTADTNFQAIFYYDLDNNC